jgi:WD40 repeat protein/regulator of replication initiation timing
MTSFDSSRVFSAFDGLVEHMQSIELPPLDTFHVSETVLPVLKTLMEQYSDQHSRTKKDIASLRSAWTCLASVAPCTPSQALLNLESSGSAMLPPASSLLVTAPDAVTDVTSGNSELENSRQLVHQLQQQLQDLTTQYEAQNEDICTENEKLRLEISELEARLLAAPSNSFSSHAVSPKCSAGIVSGKNRRNEQYLRGVFNRHKHAQAGLSRQNLVQALQDVDAPNIPISVQDIADVMNQFDANRNGVLEFGEFQQAVYDPDELQVWLGEKQLPIAADALRPLVGRGSDQLKTFSQLSPADIEHAAAATCAFIPSMLKELHQELQAAFAVQSQIEADMKAVPSKFNDLDKMACGTIADFHKGLTGRVGMPHLDFKNAMRQEHCERAGCDVQFTTGNYKITTTPRQEWQYVVENEQCPDMGHNRRFVPIRDLLQLDSSKTAKLCEEEVIAIVLYTGPMFQIYNTILRRHPKEKFELFEKGDNQFSTTIFVLVSAVQKLSRFTRIPLGTLLYRGLGGRVDLPDIFFQIDDKGCSGYAEWGFLSTTSDRDVALDYSGVKDRRPKAMVMVIETSSIDRGADISEFSQYQDEKEFLYLPCSFVQQTRQGKGRAQVVNGGLVAFVSVRINLNIKTQTVEELQAQKKSLHMVSAKSMRAEVKYVVSEVQSELTEVVQRCRQQYIHFRCVAQLVGSVGDFVDEITAKCRQVVESHEETDVKDFADDETNRRLICEVLDTKTEAIGATKWQQTRLQLLSHDFEAATCVATLAGDGSDVQPVQYPNVLDNVRASLQECVGDDDDIFDVNFVAFHPTAPLLATGSSDKTAKLWRFSLDGSKATCVANLAEQRRLHDQRRPRVVINSVAFHPTAPLLATGYEDGDAELWRFSTDGSTATPVNEFSDCGERVRSVAFHPTEPNFLATGHQDHTAKLWRFSLDGSTATCVATLEGHRNQVLSVAFQPNERLLATGSSDKTAKLWKFSPGGSEATCVATLAGHSKGIYSVAFHPTEPLLATGSSDKTAKLWRFSPFYGSEATCVATLEGHSKGINCVAFHPTAPLLATGSSDKTAKLWRFSPFDGSEATCVATLEGHSKGVNSVAFHPTAPFLATGSVNQTVKLWR